MKLEWKSGGMLTVCGRFWIQREHLLHELPMYYIMRRSPIYKDIPEHFLGDEFRTKRACQRRCQRIADWLDVGAPGLSAGCE